MDLTAFQTLLGYTFQNPALLEDAFTHRRASQKGIGYERLEFLGDRILGMCVAQKLLALYPEDAEGAIAQRYTVLVSTKNLAEKAKALHLGDYVRLGQGQMPDVRHRESILADVFEALIAALYLDGGLEVAQNFIDKHFKDQMMDVKVPPTSYKTALQEYVQKKGAPLPLYTLESSVGPDHAPCFVMKVSSKLFGDILGKGATKKEAEQDAAQKAYEKVVKKE